MTNSPRDLDAPKNRRLIVHTTQQLTCSSTVGSGKLKPAETGDEHTEDTQTRADDLLGGGVGGHLGDRA